MIGPALVTVLATAVAPAGVLLCMVLSVAGTLFFAAQRQTEPAVRPRPDGGQPAAGPRQSRARWPLRTAGRRRRRIPVPGLLTMAPLCFFLGAMFASIDLSTVDFAQRQGHKPLAGLVLGIYALGSAIGGLWYGSRAWQAPVQKRFALTLILTVAGVATFWAQPDLLSLAGGVLLAGLTISPTLIAGYGLIERQAPESRRTEAHDLAVVVDFGRRRARIGGLRPRSSTWLAHDGGTPSPPLCGAIAVSICLLGLGRLRATGDAEAAQWVDA